MIGDSTKDGISAKPKNTVYPDIKSGVGIVFLMAQIKKTSEEVIKTV